MPHVIHTKLGKGRRVVIPAEACQRFNLEPGDSIVVYVEDDQIIVKPLSKLVTEVQAFFKGFPQGAKSWSEELIDDRGAEAARENDA
jgi:AbrB family looped-hinge helix DNA binding protein